MIKQVIDVDGYWEVTVYYDIEGDLFPVFKDLKRVGFRDGETEEIVKKLQRGEAKGVTCSNEKTHVSVVIFGRHSDVYDYINSIVHEAEHVKQAMLRAYDVEDRGEPPAYTVGYLVMKMMKGVEMGCYGITTYKTMNS